MKSLSLLLALGLSVPAPAVAPAAELTPAQTQARDMLAHLIAFKTEVGQGQVTVMAKYLADQFRAAGFPEADIHILPLGEAASLVVRYRGDGSGGRPVAWMSHMDVVTARPEDWQRDPYTLIEENGFFFGRGTQDVKSGAALLAVNFLRLKREGFVPKRDFILVFTGDEETEMNTIQDLVNNHRHLIDAEFALNSDGGGGTLGEDGKPKVFGLQTAEKTYASFELTIRNPGGHSSLPRADNAIYELADALKKVQAYRFPVMWNDTTIAYFKASGQVTAGPEGEAMRRFAANPEDAGAVDLLNAAPAEVGKTRTTCIPTLLRAGHAENALPQSAVATVNCRIFPGIQVADVVNTLAGLVGEQVEIKVLGNPVASDASPLRTDVLEAVSRAVHARHLEVPIVPVQDSGASDGLYFRAAGIPTYGVSGMFIKDSDSFLHGLDERVPVQSYYDELDYWYRLMKDIGGR